MNMKTTYIIANDLDNDDAFIFMVTHHLQANDLGRAIREALGRAFANWAHTAEGEAYIKTNGTNWGDALEIPGTFLEEEGIEFIEYLPTSGGRLVVDHNENLMPEEN